MRFLRLAFSAAVAAAASTVVAAQNVAAQVALSNADMVRQQADVQIDLPAVLPIVATGDKVLLFVGTYSRDEGWVNGTGKGVHVFQFDTSDGSLTAVGAKAFGFNPTFLAGSAPKKNKRVIYATNEVADPSVLKNGTQTGYVYAISYDEVGAMTELNKVESGGPGATHVAVSPDEKFVTVANYGGGSVSIYPIQEDGSLGAATDFHKYPAGRDEAHMHSMTWIGKGNKGVFGADLGNDRVVQYQLDTRTGKLAANAKSEFITRPAGSGPRHMAIHPTKKYAYVLGELDNTIGVYTLKASTGSLSTEATQTISTLPEGFTNKSSSADIHTSECGKFLYSSNRGHDSIAIFKIGSDGKLTALGHESTRGEVPRNFRLYKKFLIVANQNTNNIEVFRINPFTGLLTHTGKSTECGTPVNILIPGN